MNNRSPIYVEQIQFPNHKRSMMIDTASYRRVACVLRGLDLGSKTNM